MPVQVPPGGQHVPRLLAGTAFLLGGMQGVLTGCGWSFTPGAPSLQATGRPSCRISSDRRLEAKCTVDLMRAQRSETTLPAPQCMEELSSVKLVPAAKKGGDHCHRSCAHDPGTQNALSWWTEELFTTFFILLSGREDRISKS